MELEKDKADVRVIVFANNWGGLQILDGWKHRVGMEVIALVVHPAWNAKYRDEILAAAEMPVERIVDATSLRDKSTIEYLDSLGPDLGVSAFFGYILKKRIIDLFPRGIVNLHTGFLPINRGWHTNIYPILDGSPAGVALHFVDEGIDSGPVLARKEVQVFPTDTGKDLHRRLTWALIDLFNEKFSSILNGSIEPAVPQNPSIATHHFRKKMRRLEEIDLDRKYRARDLINLLRALTYAPYPGAYSEENGVRIYYRLLPFGAEKLRVGAVPNWEEDA